MKSGYDISRKHTTGGEPTLPFAWSVATINKQGGVSKFINFDTPPLFSRMARMLSEWSESFSQRPRRAIMTHPLFYFIETYLHSVSSEDIARIDFFSHVIQTRIIPVGKNRS